MTPYNFGFTLLDTYSCVESCFRVRIGTETALPNLPTNAIRPLLAPPGVACFYSTHRQHSA